LIEVRRISTGCGALDALMGGGYPIGHLSLIYGEASSGKTNLALMASAERARAGLKVLYVDSDGRFPCERFLKIAGDPDCLDMLLLSSPSSFWDQNRLILGLGAFLMPSAGLVVVDSITSLYRLAVGSGDDAVALSKGLSKQLAYLRCLSRDRGLPILITSQVRWSGGDSVEPVAKRILEYWSDAIISLRRARDGLREVSILRNPGSGGLGRGLFLMGDRGLAEPRGPIPF
jgi:DNA repair protein RadB